MACRRVMVARRLDAMHQVRRTRFTGGLSKQQRRSGVAPASSLAALQAEPALLAGHLLALWNGAAQEGRDVVGKSLCGAARAVVVSGMGVSAPLGGGRRWLLVRRRL